MTNRPRNRLIQLAYDGSMDAAAWQNVRTGRVRFLLHVDVARYGVVGAWRRSAEDRMNVWRRWSGPPISPLLRMARKRRRG